MESRRALEQVRDEYAAWSRNGSIYHQQGELDLSCPTSTCGRTYVGRSVTRRRCECGALPNPPRARAITCRRSARLSFWSVLT